jgi:hypothetical protein
MKCKLKVWQLFNTTWNRMTKFKINCSMAKAKTKFMAGNLSQGKSNTSLSKIVQGLSPVCYSINYFTEFKHEN